MTTPNGVAATPARALTPEEQEDLATRAHETEAKIVKACQGIRTMGISLAKNLFEFNEEQMWRVLGYDSLNQFLAGPDIGLSKGHVMKLTRVYRELVVDRGVEMKELVGVDLEKVQFALPALKAGEVAPLDVISDARALNREDMQVHYQRGRDAPLAAEEEPERATCPTCQSFVPVERLRGEE